MEWKSRIRTALQAAGQEPDDDVVEELAQHARAMYESARADGADADDALRRVNEQVASWCSEASLLKRRSRRAAPVQAPPADVSRWVGLTHDVRYAFRLLRRAPGPTLVSMLTMSLGIGAATILFSVAWGVLFKPLPWPGADRLVRLTETREGSTRRFQRLTNGTYLAWKDAPATIEGIAGWTAQPATLAGSGEPQRIRVAEVTASLFPLLGARPAIGSVFDDEVTHGDSIVLSYALWQQQYGASRDVLGRVVRIDGEPRTIVAVMPRQFAFPDAETRAWIPMKVPPVVSPDNPQSHRISIFNATARLKPGATAAQAASEGTARGRAAPDPGLVAMAMFGTRGPVVVTAVPMLEAMTADVRTPLLVFLVAVGLLLATATANVASVQLARSAARRREMAIRSAIGAGSGRLARQLLVENLLLGSIAGLAGLLSALAFERALPALLPADFPRVADITINLPVLAFAIGVSVIVSLAFGSLPALHARRIDLVQSLMEDGLAPVGASRRSATARLRMLIMAGQVAVACVLLVGASLLVQSFEKLMDADRGYDVNNVLTARMPLPDGAYTPERRREIMNGVLLRLGQVPGVTQAASTDILPLGSSDALMAFTMPSPSGGEPTQVHASVRTVSPGYFAAMRIRLLDGRTFTDRDTQTSLPVVIVNRTFAARYLGNAPIGRRLPVGFEDGKLGEVVGIADDVRMRSVTDPAQPEIFMLFAQLRGLRSSEPSIVVRTTGDPSSFIPALRAAVRAEDSAIALEGVVTMEQRLVGNLARPRLYAVLIGAFAAFALIIAAVGLFGVLSYSVSQRSREIAVRSALGARPGDIARLVVRQGLAVTGAGLIAGLAASVVLTGAIRSFLFGVQVHDARTFVVVPLLLLAVAAIACFVPARRAARLDPLKVLKAG